MSNLVPAGVARSFSEMIWRGSILLLVYRVGARSDVTVGVWRAVEKGGNGTIGRRRQGQWRGVFVHTCLASLRCLDSRGGCRYMRCGAAGEQQVPRAPSARFGMTKLWGWASNSLRGRWQRMRTWGSFDCSAQDDRRRQGQRAGAFVHTCLASLRSLDSRGGCRYMSCGAAGDSRFLARLRRASE